MNSVVKYLIALCIAFSSTTSAELSVLDFEGIPELWGEGQVSPFDGHNALHEFANYRALPENYNAARKPYACHYQSRLVDEKDCPQSWPATVLQFLFPLPFVPNQATLYDPLNHLKHNKLASLITAVARAQASITEIATDYQLFTKTRESLIATIYPLDGSLLRKSIRVDIDKAFETIATEFNDPTIFLENFSRAQAAVRARVVPLANNNQAKRVADHFLSRSVAENFVNAILGTLLLAQEDGKTYYRNFVTKALYAYFSGIAETRDEILALYEFLSEKSRPSMDLSSTTNAQGRFSQTDLTSFLSSHPLQGEDEARLSLRQGKVRVDDKRRWLQHQYNQGFGDEKRIMDFLDNAFNTTFAKLSLAAPDVLAALLTFANAREMKVPPLMRYKTATVKYQRDKKLLSITHSDCGETGLRFLLGLSMFDPELGVYDPDMWFARVEHFGLKPHAGIPLYFSKGDGGKRSAFDDPKNSSHNDFSELVTSNLNQQGAFGDDVLYTKPHDRPFTEINPGIDNVLNVLHRLFGDGRDEEEYSTSDFLKQVSPQRATLSLTTLYHLKNEALSHAHSGEVADILGKFRKYQMNRFFKLISPLPGSGQSLIRWLAQTRDDELQNNFETLTISAFGVQLNWEIAADHFDLYFAKGEYYSHRFAYLADQLIERLLERSHSNPIERSNLHRLLINSRKLPILPPTIEALKRAFAHEPELIYSFPLRMPSERVAVAQWILKHEIEILYPFAAAWLATIPTKSGEACSARFTLGATFEKILLSETSLPSSPRQTLIDHVIIGLAEPWVLAFSGNQDDHVVHRQMFKRVLDIRGNDADATDAFFYRNSCGVTPAITIAQAGLHEAFSYFENRYPGHGRDWLQSDAFNVAIHGHRSPPVHSWYVKQNELTTHPVPMIDTGPIVRGILAADSTTSEDLLSTKYGKPTKQYATGYTALHQAVDNIASNSERAAGASREHWEIFLDMVASGKFSREHFLAVDYKGKSVLQLIEELGLQELMNFVREHFENSL